MSLLAYDMIGRLLKDRRGNVTVMVALAAIPLMFAGLGALELGAIAREKADLQNAVDQGALSGASRLSVATVASTAGPLDTAVAVARQTLADERVTSAVTLIPSFNGTRTAITVDAVADHKALIGFLDFGSSRIHATATAEGLASSPLCILQTGLGGKGIGINVDNTARIRATGCAIHANQNITVKSSAMIQADRTQAVGTVTGPVSPVGNSGALKIDDPFAAMNLVPPTTCIGKPVKIKQLKGTTEFLPPGVHCEQYEIDKDATLVLMPGDHYFMDDLKAQENAIIRGDDVVLIFGSTKKINFADHASVELGARRSGPFAGFLIITTRDNHESFVIASDNVSKLLGTIYIPDAELDVETAGNVAQDSAWSIIVADTLSLKQNPILVINTGYAGSGVPVPSGVGPSMAKPRLSH